MFSNNSFAVENISIFDGYKVLKNHSLIVEDGIITQVGKQIIIPKGISTFHGIGKTLLPGLIDSHTHVYGEALRASLRFGVTTSLDMFTSPAMLKNMKDKRQSLTNTSASDLWSAGILATVPGGHGTQFPVSVETITTADEAHTWVANRIAEGSDYIKLVYMPNNNYIKSLDLITASAIIKAGHDQGVMVVAHISTLKAAQEMLDAGIDGLVHIFTDKPVTERFIAQAVKDGIFVIPTLTVIAAVDGQKTGAALAANPQVTAYLTTLQKQGLVTNFGTSWPSFDFDIGMQNTLKLYAAGVPILAGSDAPNPGTTHGASLHQEMELLVRAGLTPLAALSAATAVPAQAFGIKGRGSIKVGARADFITVVGRPDVDISRSLFIDKIIKNGYEVKREKPEGSDNMVHQPLESSLLGTFDTDILPSTDLAEQGFTWEGTDDRMANGNSEARVYQIENGADETGGALRVHAKIKSGFLFPWAGAYFARTDQAARNIDAYKAISFQIRGTPGKYTALMFTTGMARIPPAQTFNVSHDWKTITLDMEAFSGLKSESFVGFAITAGPALGLFDYDIDNVIFRE
ncbi:MAG: amidohydrolase family protein [Xanthomonadales bacterium]|nr:amidohydrolase family protein [Xanthomonadales bacterium]